MQVAASFIDPGRQRDPAANRSPSACSLAPGRDGAVTPIGLHPTPNFSVPHSSNRRFSHAKAPSSDADGSPPLEPSRLARGKPPPALRASRTLSIVMDQLPPLHEAASQRPVTAYRGDQAPSSTMYINHQRLRSASRGRQRAGSVGANWVLDGPASKTGRWAAPRRQPEPEEGVGSPPSTPQDRDADKYQSSFLDLGTPQSRPRESPGGAVPEAADEACDAARDGGRRRSVARGRGSPTGRIQAQASSPHLKVQMTEKALLNRRSMPQLTEGPPPAPPPTRALPPIPRNMGLGA